MVARRRFSRIRRVSLLAIPLVLCMLAEWTVPRDMWAQCRDIRIITAVRNEDGFGAAIAGGQDVDGDGVPDFAITEVGVVDTTAGHVKVYSGRTGAIVFSFDGSFLDGVGSSVALVPDLDGDGHAEVLVGATRAWPGLNNGIVYLLSGATGQNLVAPHAGIQDYELYGRALAVVGDFDGDSTTDYAIGSDRRTIGGKLNAGVVSVFSGRNGSELFHREGSTSNGHFGISVASAGDFNGDGLADVLVGEVDPADVHTPSGRFYVFAGGSGQLLLRVDAQNGRGLGSSIAGLGDFNRDGFDDIAAGYSVGTTIFLGRAAADRIVTTASADVVITGGGPATIGDINADGYDDLVMSAPYQAPNGSRVGRVVAFTGREVSSPLSLTLADAYAVCPGGDSVGNPLGSLLAPTGDTDGDGVPEFIAITRPPFGTLTLPRAEVLEFSSLQMLDIQDPRWLDTEFHLIRDPEALAVGGSSRSGVAADGSARLLLRFRAPTSGVVTFRLGGPNGETGEEFGVLRPAFGSDLPGHELAAATFATAAGPSAFAIYEAPVDFERPGVPGDALRPGRKAKLSCEFSGTGTAPVTQDVTILRPPVVLAHGIWSDSRTWRWPDLLHDGRWHFELLDYRSSHAAAFSTNSPIVRVRIDAARDWMRNRLGVASTKVDYIGHSMGGLLGRVQTSDPGYLRLNNAGLGDYHKFITLDTPHRGLEIAAWGLRAREVLEGRSAALPGAASYYERLLRIVQSGLGLSDEPRSVFLGEAVRDLSPGSAALSGLTGLSVPTHVHFGTGGSDIANQAGGGANGYLQGCLLGGAKELFLAYLTAIDLGTNGDPFVGIEHDGLVSVPSQLGGLGIPAASSTDFLSGLHTHVTGAQRVESIVSELLVAPTSSPLFATELPQNPVSAMPPVANASLGVASVASRQVLSHTYSGQLLAFRSPAADTVVDASGSFPVLVSLHPGAAGVKEVVVLAGEHVALLEAPGFVGQVSIGEVAAGETEMMAFAFTEDSSLIDAAPIRILRRIPGTPDSLRISATHRVLVARGEITNFLVEARYPSGLWYDVTSPTSGVRLESSQEEILALRGPSSGQAVGRGIAVVTAHLDALADTISIECQDAGFVNNPPIANAGDEYIVCPGHSVCLNGSQSSDPDLPLGDMLSFAWDVNGDGKYGDLVGPTPCFDVPEDGPELVAVRVADARGDTTFDSALLRCDATTATLLSLRDITATTDHVIVRWYSAQDPPAWARVYRSVGGGPWIFLGDAVVQGPDIFFEDRAPIPGQRQGYKLGIPQGALEEFVAEAWVDVISPAMALRVLPNPARQRILVELSLRTDGDASLDLLDVHGRMLTSLRVVGRAGESVHASVGDEQPLRSGIYWLRLTQGTERVMERVTLMN